MKRSEKENQVSELRSIFENMTAGILVDYRGIEANQIVGLRKKLNEVSSNLKVIKNSLARIASENTPFSELSDQFTQTRAIIYSDKDPVIQAKVLLLESKNVEKLKILAGILIDGNKTNILNSGEIEALSKLPSREDLLVKFLFLLKAPANQFVRTLNAVPEKFVRTLATIRDKKN